jgi:exonuclease III
MALHSNQVWNILSWNVRGINSQAKWDYLRDKIAESVAAIVCIQETKRDSFDSAYISKFCPRHLNKFYFSPSVGASGGLLIIWNINLFTGDPITITGDVITVKFNSSLSDQCFHVTNVYGP